MRLGIDQPEPGCRKSATLVRLDWGFSQMEIGMPDFGRLPNLPKLPIHLSSCSFVLTDELTWVG